MANLVSLTIDADTRKVVKAAGDLNRLGNAAKKTTDGLNRYERGTQRATRETDRMSTAMNKLRGMVGLLSAGFAGIGFVSLAQQIERATTQMNNINATMRVAAGSANSAAMQIAFIREESQRLGLFFPTMAKQMAQFSAAARSSSMTSQELKDVFTGIAEASRAMGLTAPQAEGAMLALQQMMSKGKVSAEELRQQLGERMPGSIQIMANALDVTTSKLFEMMENGELLSDEVLPKFGRELSKVFSGQASLQADRIAASIQRLRTSFFDLMSQGDLQGAAMAIDELAEIISSEDFQESFDNLVQIATQLGVVFAENIDAIIAFAKAAAALGLAKVISGLSSTVSLFTSLLGKVIPTTAATVGLVGALQRLQLGLGALAGPAGILVAVGAGLVHYGQKIFDVKEETLAWLDATDNVKDSIKSLSDEEIVDSLESIDSLVDRMETLNNRAESFSQGMPMNTIAPGLISSLGMRAEAEAEQAQEAIDTYDELRAEFIERGKGFSGGATGFQEAFDDFALAQNRERISIMETIAEYDKGIAQAIEYANNVKALAQAYREFGLSAEEAGEKAREILGSTEESVSATEKQSAALQNLASIDPGTGNMLEYAESVRIAAQLLTDGWINGEKFNEILARQKSLLNENANSYDNIRSELDANFSALVNYERMVERVANEESLSAEQRAELIGLAKEAYEEATKAAEDLGEQSGNTTSQIEKDFERVANQVENEFSDAFYNIFEDGLDSFDDLADGITDIFKRTLADMAAAAIRQQIVIPITQQIVGGAGGIVNAGGQILSGGGFGGLGGAASLGSLLNPGAGAGLARGLAFSNVGQSLGLSTVGGMTPAGAGMGLTQSGSRLVGAAGAATSLAGIGGGFIGSQLGGGTTEANIGSTLGTIAGGFAGPVGAFLGGIAGGFLGGLFGDDEPDPSLFRGTLSQQGSGFRARSTLRSPTSQSETNRIGDFLNKAFFEYAKMIDNSVQDTLGRNLGEVLGDESVSFSISNIVEDYLSGEDASPQKAVNEIVKAIGGVLGDRIPGVVGDSIQKLQGSGDNYANNLETVTGIIASASNPVLEQLGIFADKTESTGNQFVQALVSLNQALDVLEITGNIQDISNVTGSGSFAENIQAFANTVIAVEQTVRSFDTQQESVERAKTELDRFTQSSDFLGRSVLRTADQFQTYLNSLDLTSERGREAAQSAIQYAGAVQQVNEETERVLETQKRLEGQLVSLYNRQGDLIARQTEEMTDENAALQIAISSRENLRDAQQAVSDAEQDLANIYQNQVSTAQDLASAWENTTRTLRQTADELLGIGSGQETNIGSQFQSALNRAIGGDRSAFESLPGLAQNLSDFRLQQAGSLQEARRQNARIANQLLKASDIAEQQFMSAVSERDVAQQQLDSLTQTELTLGQANQNLEMARAQLSSAQDATTQAVNKVTELLPNSIASSLEAPLSPLEAIKNNTKGLLNALGGIGSGTGQSDLSDGTSSNGMAFDSTLFNAANIIYRSATGGVPTPEYEAAIDAAKRSLGTDSLLDVYDAVNWRGDVQSFRNMWGFADGGIARGPQSGYPATLHGTEAVIPMNGERIPLEVNNQEMIQELREVKQELAQLRSEQEQSQYELVKYTKRNNRQFEQWDIDGLPETRTA